MHKKPGGIQVTVDVALPAPAQPGKHDCPDTIEDRVEAACELIESGHDSREEWDFIRALNNELMRRKQRGLLGERGKALLKLMAPTINKHGMQDPRGVELDPELATE